MALEDDFGYEVDASIKKVKGKVSKPLKVKLLTKKSPVVKVVSKKKRKKVNLTEVRKQIIDDDSTPNDGGVQPN
tara:strand:+ start:970 stop:1191 length:222 start_codon:yes stop_codon:yes gene_type:complete